MGEGDFFAAFFIDGDMDGLAGPDQGLVAFKNFIGKRERRGPDVPQIDMNVEAITHKKRGFVVGLDMDDRQKEIGFSKNIRETESDFFQNIFIRIVHDRQLMTEKKDPSGIGLMETDFCFITVHGVPFNERGTL